MIKLCPIGPVSRYWGFLNWQLLNQMGNVYPFETDVFKIIHELLGKRQESTIDSLLIFTAPERSHDVNAGAVGSILPTRRLKGQTIISISARH